MRALGEISKDIHAFASSLQGFSLDHCLHLRRLADEITARHDHADPCDDEYCPCYKAARDWMRDQRGDRP